MKTRQMLIGTSNEPHCRGSTVDAAEVERFGAGHGVVGPARQNGGAAPVQSGAARLHQGRGLPAFRPRRQASRRARGPAHPRHRLRRRDSERALGAAGGGGRGRRSGRAEYRGREGPCRRGRPDGGLPCNNGRGAGGRGRALRCRARHGGGRARRRSRPLRRALRRDGEARRADDRGHAEPHAQELRAGDRRRRIRAALAAARHPPVGQVRHAERARSARWSATGSA